MSGLAHPSRVAVTGGTGFIGSHLVDRLLADGHEVLVIATTPNPVNLALALGNPRCSVVSADICGDDATTAIVEFAPQVVFHLAASASVPASIADPVHDAQVGVVGSVRIFEAARLSGASRIVATASGGTLYGNTTSTNLPLKESAPWRPISPYGIAKRAMLDYLRFYSETHHLTTVGLAIANAYGPRQSSRDNAGLVATLVNKMVNGEPPVIFGDGTATRDYVYVDDVVDALMLSGFKDLTGHHVMNIGSGVETSAIDILVTLSALLGVNVYPKFQGSYSGQVSRIALCVDHAREVLGWTPRTALLDGLSQTARALHETP